ncbi:FMN-binding protein [Luteibacter yeojuensis]|uniref:FMN-binding protein n=1 Tax=Luteibacter yeojuensis TaxID=345309 RepID=A0A0F3KWU7_9GAMM|nr:FMN-binding protein [Luteibacter yeojuensis]KJV35688.1 FMN-binding protein [Luteibacter yeojuensis]
MDHRFLLLPVAALVAVAPAQATQYLSADQARALIFPSLAMTAQDITLTPEQARAVEKASGASIVSPSMKAWRATTGELFIVDEVLGKHEYITYAVGFDASGGVKGLEILTYNESYGDQIRNPAWRAQFTGKHDDAPLVLDKDIQNISSATLSCKHITEGVRRLLAVRKVALGHD